ncbi:unnamed protein product [Gulo gulo]|uniref:Uncharacterized protein n=1 Tax=Gulo gulo TaxID=48420 RepID=A0A9X9LWI4_GULGU|nr:unnamed protein product [Gulo gulo]
MTKEVLTGQSQAGEGRVPTSRSRRWLPCRSSEMGAHMSHVPWQVSQMKESTKMTTARKPPTEAPTITATVESRSGGSGEGKETDPP